MIATSDALAFRMHHQLAPLTVELLGGPQKRSALDVTVAW